MSHPRLPSTPHVVVALFGLHALNVLATAGALGGAAVLAQFGFDALGRAPAGEARMLAGLVLFCAGVLAGAGVAGCAASFTRTRLVDRRLG